MYSPSAFGLYYPLFFELCVLPALAGVCVPHYGSTLRLSFSMQRCKIEVVTPDE